MIIGHKNIRHKLSHLIAQDQFPQAALFYGLSGSGKKLVALCVAQTLLCENPVSKENLLEACGSCRSCDLFRAQNHPDFFLITPTLPKSKTEDAVSLVPQGSIKTEQVVELKKKLAYPALVSARQVVIVDDAELMTEVTANSLLKFIEEPKAGQVFIFITSQLHKILITIRSRCAKMFFAPLENAEVLQVIVSTGQEVNAQPEALNLYLDCFAGSPSYVAHALKMNLDLRKMESVLARDFDFLQVSDLVKDVVKSDMDLPLFLQCLRGFCLKRLKDNASANRSADLAFLDKIALAERRLDKYIQAEFVLENLFL